MARKTYNESFKRDAVKLLTDQGYSLSQASKALGVSAMRSAVDSRKPDCGLIHHSDRGSQYASDIYQQLLGRHGVVCSMSRKGNCWDNAMAESFFGTLKTELQEQLTTRQATRSALFEYIEVFYNRQRLHSALGYQSPAAYEQKHQAA